MNEAIRVVKAKLNEALDKNDAKAVREACIVLKAMERKAIDMGQVDVEQEVKINDALRTEPPAIVETVDESYLRNMPVILKQELPPYIEVLREQLNVSPEEFNPEEFKQTLLRLVQMFESDPEAVKYIENNSSIGLGRLKGLSNIVEGYDVTIGESNTQMDIAKELGRTDLSENAKINLSSVISEVANEGNRTLLIYILFIIGFIASHAALGAMMLGWRSNNE